MTREDRYLILSVYDYLIVNVYMPVCKDSDVYKNCVLEILAGISNVFDQYPNAKIIMAGDFNCDVGSNSIGGKLIQQFMPDHKLICCDKWCDSSLQFTYCNASLGHRSFVDHILILGSLEHTVQSCAILDSGTNLSDHLPVTLKLLVTDSIDHGVRHRATKDVKLSKLRWDKADFNNYYWDAFINLSCYDVSYFTSDDNSDICSDCPVIDDLYEFIVDGLMCAAIANVSRTTNNFYKHWWGDNLKELKAKSVDAQVLWESCGRPSNGDVYNIKRCAKANYKGLCAKKFVKIRNVSPMICMTISCKRISLLFGKLGALSSLRAQEILSSLMVRIMLQ